MKVSLYGNALNLAFLLGLFLRRKGHEVRVFVNEASAEYDKPEWECVDAREMAAVPLTQVDVDVKRMLVGGRREHRFRRAMAEADVVQTFGEGVIWSAGTGTPDTVLSIGDDLDDLPFRRHSLRIRIYAALLRRAQRRCKAVCYTMPPQEESCRRLGLRHASFLPCAIPIDTERFHPLSRSERAHVRARLGVPETAYVVFQPSRQEWTCSTEWAGSNHKANDRFLRGLARFCHERGKDTWLMAVTKGSDVARSQRLAQELGIADRIRWIPQQNKAGLRDCLGACDVVADQFTYGFYGICTLEAMAVGRPVLVHLESQRLKEFGVEPPPVISVRTAEEIFVALGRLADDRHAAEAIGGQAREWMIRHHGWEPVVDRYLDLYRRIS